MKDTTDHQRVIAAFDFDGTIISRDSLPLFIRSAVTFSHLLWGSIVMAPFVFLFKLRVIPNYKAKERLFRTFFAGMQLSRFNEIAAKFKPALQKIVQPAALAKIRWHQEMGHEVIIISASVQNWIAPWAAENGIDMVLATHLEVKEGVITGNFLTRNCHGAEKVVRLLEKYPDRESYTLYAYGDSNGDKELLALADHAFYRKF